MRLDIASLVVEEDLRPFRPINPPFNFNAPGVAAYAPEVTGYYLLQAVLQRLGWTSFAGKHLVDFGCGVRFARTLQNLAISVGFYTGIDIHAEAISWLDSNLPPDRFAFHHLDAHNRFYNPAGRLLDENSLAGMVKGPCDVAIMFSVITHQEPSEASLTFRQLRKIVRSGGFLYFTAFLREIEAGFAELEPGEPGHKSAYSAETLCLLVEQAGWQVSKIYTQQETLQQPAFVCTAI
jgi:SAM-dependent methyltransferase